MIDDAPLTLGVAREQHLPDDGRQACRRRFRSRRSADSSRASGSALFCIAGLSPGSSGIRSSSTMIERPVALDHGALAGEVQRDDWNASRGRCIARRRARSSSTAETRGCSRPSRMRALYSAPELRTLLLGIPPVLRPTESRTRAPWRATSLRRGARRRRPHRSRYWSSACRSACVFMMSVCSADPWSNGLMPVSSPSRLMCTRRSSPSRDAVSSRNAIISRNFQVVSTCSNGNGGRAGIERLQRQVQHHRAVLADRVEHHRPLALGDDLAHDVDALGFEPLQVRQAHSSTSF